MPRRLFGVPEEKPSGQAVGTVANTAQEDCISCKFCFLFVTSEPNNPATTVRPKTKKGKVGIILGIVIGVIAFVVIAIAAGIMWVAHYSSLFSLLFRITRNEVQICWSSFQMKKKKLKPKQVTELITTQRNYYFHTTMSRLNSRSNY